MDTAPRIRLFTLLGLFLSCMIAAGYVFYDLAYGVHTPRPSAFSTEDTIRVEHRTRHRAANDHTITSANPADPSLDESVTAFYCSDGVLEISQFKKAPPPGRAPILRFIPQRKPAHPFRYYTDPMAEIAGIADPLRRALTLQAYSDVFARPLPLFNNLGLSREQVTKESAARAAMNGQIAAIRRSTSDGTFDLKAMEAVMAALEAYDRMPGDPTQDAAKNKAATNVLQAASHFNQLVLTEERKVIEPYMETMDALLSPDQKTRLAAIATRYAPATSAVSRRAAIGRVSTGPTSRISK